MKKFLLFFLIVLFTLPADCLEVFSFKLNTTNGLPDNNIRSLAQDSKGFIWMGSPTGLYRYDGYFFTTYKYAETGNLQLLNNNHIDGCYSLSDGRMLFREKGNLFTVFDPQQGMFIDLPSQQKEALFQQVRMLHAPDSILKPYKHIIEKGGSYINDNLGNVIVLDQTGQIWFIDRKTRETIYMKVFDEHLFPVITSHKYKVLTSERTGLIWVSTNGCGITLHNRKTHETKHITRQSGLLATDEIQDICLDNNDNLWAADEFHGVVCLTPERNHNETYLLNTSGGGLRSNQVRILQWVSESLLWVANTQGEVYEALVNKSQTPSTIQLRKLKSEQALDIHSICSDQTGKLWIGSRKQGLRLPNGCWLPHNDNDSNTPSSNNINAVFCDRDGAIWIGCEGGQLDLLTNASSISDDITSHTPVIQHFLPDNTSPKVIIQDSKGFIWCGTRTGLYCFNPTRLLSDTSLYQHVLTKHHIHYSDVTCIYEDPRQRLWIGTSGDGLYRSDNAGKTFQHITRTDGLISDEIQSLIATGDSILWIATTNGITRYRINDGHCQYVFNEYNLQQNFYGENCITALPDGRLAFGTNKGIVVYSDELWTQTSKKKLTITDLLVNGESINLSGGEFTLDHNQNTLSIHFSTFSFSNSTRFTYRLENYDKQWSDLSSYSFASYKNLSPGRYVLHVKAYDNGASADIEQQLIIVIKHPWWQTWWAYLFYLLTTIIIVTMVYRQIRTIYSLRRKISIEKELTEYKLQFFTNISHEFRTPLTIIRGAMDRIKRESNIPAEMRQPVSSMNKSVERMLRLINQLLEFRKMQNNKLRLALEETEVVKFVNDIFMNFWDLAENKHINYSFITQERTYTMFVDRSHLDKIVYNLLSNALKYTPTHGDVTLHIGFGDGKMTISVEDSGIGIPKEKQKELFSRFMQNNFSNDSIGIGLNLTKALVEVHHGSIEFTPNKPKGSIFTITIPADPSVYATDDFLAEGHQLLTQKTEIEKNTYKELASTPMNDRSLLIVEDDADVMDYLENLLQKYFIIYKAADGQEARRQLEQLRPSLIISDIMMPVMNGLELTAHIRKTPEISDIPIILLTALTTVDKRIKAMEKGADAYLTKPFDAQLLVTTIVRLIQQRDMLKSAYMQQTAENKTALPEIIVDERDKAFIEVLDRWVSAHLSDPMLSVDTMAEAMGYRRTVFFKKIKDLTGQTPADYIKTLRMNRAAEMLREETITVAEVCYKVGISDPHYFAKVFKQQFGISPKKYQQGTTTSSQ